MNSIFVILVLISSSFAISQDSFTTIFCHGLGGDENQVIFYTENNTYNNLQLVSPLNWSILKNIVSSFSFPHATKNGINPKLVSLAQDIEINAIKNHVNTITGPKIFMGLSMGASSIITYMSNNFTPDVKALILESPFDAVESIISHQISAFSWIPGSQSAATSLMGTFMYPSYKKTGIKPITCIKNLNKNLPILLIHSNADTLIPVQSSRRLYCSLKQAGHQQVHLLELNDGSHANYFSGKDAQKYQETVHAFYKKYNLPCDESLAQAGQKYLTTCQPSVQQVRSRK